MADDDDRPQLSADTMAILQAFLKEKEEAKSAHTREAAATDKVTLITSEDWELSQFWYDAETCTLLANEVFAQAAASGVPSPVVACLSCPSTYKAMLALGLPSNVTARILEFDKRFGDAFGDAFAFYDYNAPLEFPPALRGAVDVAVIDPPFLNPDCLAGFAATLRAMARPGQPLRIMLCSGAVMLPHARRLLDVRPVRARIRHEGGRLSNPFSLYLSSSDEAGAARCGGWDTEAEEAAASASAAEATGGGGAAGGQGKK